MFITFEGIEGCGKTTQIGRLVHRLESHGTALVTSLEPGGTSIGKKIRKILLDSRNMNLFSITELMLYLADRAQHVEEVVKPALNEGKWVICDRFFDATVVYQGVARGLDMKMIKTLNEVVTQGIQPDMTFLLDLPVQVGLSRAIEREGTSADSGQDRFEREKLAFHEKVREGYLELSRLNPERFIVIDGTLSADEVQKEIFKHIGPLINDK